jgi:hypothetical protein
MKGILRIRNLKNNSTISFFLLFRLSGRERWECHRDGLVSYRTQIIMPTIGGHWSLSLSLSPATNVDTVKIHPTNLQRWRAIDIQFKSRALALHQPDSFPFPSTVFGVELVGVCHALKCNRSQPVSTCCWPIAPYLYYTGLAFDLFGYSTDVHGRKMQ